MSNRSAVAAAPLYRKIKNHILERIRAGDWAPGMRVPSENDLVKQFGVSRMTTNRALRELTDEGYLERLAGVGTFVADLKARSHPLEIHNIADEVRNRGHHYSAQVLALEKTQADPHTAQAMGLEVGTEVFHSLILHEEQGQPIQLEDRFVNATVVPGYLEQDFTRITPYEYLITEAPLLQAEHVVRAVQPSAEIRAQLCMDADEPCLLIERRTWSHDQVATIASLYHPGNRYELSGKFTP
ncbi:histidine utilization repressor [Luteithermobacter gelatinilyticus]|uniref:histidine utilization repressor n=1 Tax=Luteithermobacter gelatinilyticus TaxID=2582913 RepID=UPI0011074580|nr:histidine utilization repressor [Luteithermobacter gelatinilyticus]|tara:strand:+ start:6820 stop:7542 length:723 start_codon:yes stop_codon:yes gene_type:complete